MGPLSEQWCCIGKFVTFIRYAANGTGNHQPQTSRELKHRVIGLDTRIHAHELPWRTTTNCKRLCSDGILFATSLSNSTLTERSRTGSNESSSRTARNNSATWCGFRLRLCCLPSSDSRRQTKSSTSSSAGSVDIYGSRNGGTAERRWFSSPWGCVVWTPARKTSISSLRLANIHTCCAGVSTSCDLAPMSATAHSLSRISKECTGMRIMVGDRIHFWHEITTLAYIFDNTAAIIGTKFGIESRRAQATSRRGGWFGGGWGGEGARTMASLTFLSVTMGSRLSNLLRVKDVALSPLLISSRAHLHCWKSRSSSWGGP